MTGPKQTASDSDVQDISSFEPIEEPVNEMIDPLDDAGETDDAQDAAGELKKKELIDLVVARSGGKKRDVKPAVEACLAVLGEMLAEGRDLNLPPMGKLKVTRTKQADNARILVARIRQREESGNSAPDPLAHAAE
jgi:hypothetical protein